MPPAAAGGNIFLSMACVARHARCIRIRQSVFSQAIPAVAACPAEVPACSSRRAKRRWWLVPLLAEELAEHLRPGRTASGGPPSRQPNRRLTARNLTRSTFALAELDSCNRTEVCHGLCCARYFGGAPALGRTSSEPRRRYCGRACRDLAVERCLYSMRCPIRFFPGGFSQS